jgi:muramoyltetrapeptide carboxypeptidase
MQTSSKVRWPKVLDAGARVALVAPSGPLRGESDVERAESHVRAFGWEPVRGAHALSRRGYLAGNDAERFADLQRALDDPGIDAVWCMRGGYGLTRIVSALSLGGFRRAPKAVLGYSDVTALHAHIAQGAQVVTFHAPVARTSLPSMSQRSLLAAVTRRAEPCGEWNDATVVRSGVARGRVTGGNLALLASLCGTPQTINADGAIVVLEDVHEAAYRVDRMLRQLEAAGALRGCVGLAIGQFTDVPTDDNVGAASVSDLIAELADRLGVPCLANLPIGHIDDQWTVPLGAQAELDVDARMLRFPDCAVAVPTS